MGPTWNGTGMKWDQHEMGQTWNGPLWHELGQTDMKWDQHEMGRAWNGTLGPEMGLTWNGTDMKWPDMIWPTWFGPTWNGRAWNGIYPYYQYRVFYAWIMIQTDWIIISLVPLLSLSERQLAGISTLQNPGPHIRIFRTFFLRRRCLRFFEEMRFWRLKKKSHLESKQLLMLS